ncbi:MAG: hypothetical protein ACLFVC_03405 [Opitutales bacterium]
MRTLLAPLLALSFVSWWTGCASSGGDHSEFVKTINFSTLDSFSYKGTLVSGFDFRDSEELLLEELSEEVLTEALRAKDFESIGSGGDFHVVVKWRKAVSSHPGTFDSIDGARESLDDRDDPSHRFAARMHLTVEMYETETGNLFWRKDLPNIFDANQFTEERIVASLQRAVENFPERVEKDPELPDIE